MLGSAAFIGSTPPLSKILLKATDPFMSAGLLYLGAGIGLAIYGYLRAGKEAAGEASLARADLPRLALAPEPSTVTTLCLALATCV